MSCHFAAVCTAASDAEPPRPPPKGERSAFSSAPLAAPGAAPFGAYGPCQAAPSVMSSCRLPVTLAKRGQPKRANAAGSPMPCSLSLTYSLTHWQTLSKVTSTLNVLPCLAMKPRPGTATSTMRSPPPSSTEARPKVVAYVSAPQRSSPASVTHSASAPPQYGW